MEHRTTQRSHSARAAALAIVAAALAAAPAQAELPAFGMVSLSVRQTAVLHAVLTHEPNPDHPGCWVTASFVDDKGTTFKDPSGKEITASWVLEDNVAQSLSVRAADILGEGQRRTLIRAALRETPNPGAASNCCALTLTLEVMNGIGSSDELGVTRAPNPPNPICVAPVITRQ